MAVNGSLTEEQISAPVPLHNQWCFWKDDYSNKGGSNEYSSNLEMYCTVSTVQEFWTAYNSIISPDKLSNRTSLHFFKKGVQPIWEDPMNQNGGSWSFRLNKNDTALVWPEILMLCIGELLESALDEDDKLVGVSIGSRWSADVLQIWNYNSTKAENLDITKAFPTALSEVQFNSPFYKAHKDHTDFKKH